MSPRAALIPIASLAVLAAACATQPQPTEELTRARAVVQQADKTSAQRYAAADLQRAHDELGDADRANGEHKYDEARRYAESAEVDADLASARGSAGDAQQAAHEVIQGNETLRQESNRDATGNRHDMSPVYPAAPAGPTDSGPPPSPPPPAAPEAGPSPNSGPN